jgi:hypothetical protein
VAAARHDRSFAAGLPEADGTEIDRAGRERPHRRKAADGSASVKSWSEILEAPTVPVVQDAEAGLRGYQERHKNDAGAAPAMFNS